MGIFDGTFESETKYPLPKRNIDAIKYFTKNGGHFSFCTGRLDPHLRKRGLSELVNVPCCIANGAIIYDFKKNCIIKSSVLSRTAAEILDIMKDSLHFIKSVHLAVTDNFVVFNPPFDMNCNIKANKAVFVFENEQDADVFLRTASVRFDDYYVSKSWPVGVELVGKDSTKGTAIEYIKEYVGAHTSYGIGNYGNDLPLLQHADIGVAVGNATDDIKKAADMIVCDYMQDAIADLIYKIEDNLKNV